MVRNRILGFDFWYDAFQPFLTPLGILEMKIFSQSRYRSVYSLHFSFSSLGFIWFLALLTQNKQTGCLSSSSKTYPGVSELTSGRVRSVWPPFQVITGQFHTRICALFRIGFPFQWYHFFKFPYRFSMHVWRLLQLTFQSLVSCYYCQLNEILPK